MNKIKLLFFSILGLVSFSNAQNAYEIKVSIKNSTDTVCYLTRYTWDQQRLIDTAKVKNGNMTFSGKKPLEKGIYSIIRQSQKALYFDFLVTEVQKFSVTTDTLELYKKMKFATGPKVNQDFVDFVIFMSAKNKDRYDFEQEIKKKKTPDSTKLMNEKTIAIFKDIKQFQKDYIAKNPDNYLAQIIRLQMDPEVPEAPILSNGRKDSIFPYNYYKAHFWDGIPLNDVGMLNTNKLFYERLKRYFEKVILQMPDSLIKDVEWLVNKTNPDKEMFKYMVYYLTTTTESSKIMCMDAVFVNIVNKYYKTGKAYWVEEKQLNNIIKRAAILEPICCQKIAPDLPMIDTVGIKTIQKLGMDTISSSDKLTMVYYANHDAIQKLLVNLNQVKAEWTVLVFWDVDCGHCKKEIPIVLETYHKLKKEGKNIEVFAVYTQHEYDKWKKFIRENKLDWMNVTDGVHLNNIKDKFDIYSTPVIYILDKDKRIRAKKIAADQLENLLNAFEKEKAAKK